MKQPTYKKILEHPDRDELIGKLVIGASPTDIHDWLKIKYSAVSEAKFVLSEKTVASFVKNYLDFYNDMQTDLAKTKTAIATNTTDDLSLIVKSNPSYQDALTKLANGELDVETIMAKMILNLESRLSQIYDLIQDDPHSIDTRVGRLMGEYIDTLGNLLDKYHKWKEGGDKLTINHNVTLQVVDQHIAVFHDVIKEVLSQMDLETSLYFLEVFNEKMGKLKLPSPGDVPTTEMKLAEAHILNETINKKINEK